MKGRFFDQLVDSSWHQQTKSKRRLTLPVSIAVHILILGAVVIIPLLSLEQLPEPERAAVRAFFVEAAPPPPPPPPPPPAPAKAAARPKVTKRTIETPRREVKLVAPIEVPDKIAAETGVDSGDFFPSGVPEGVHGGVDGGVAGGVIGGVAGGVPGGVLPATPRPPPPPPTPRPVARSPVRVGGQIKAPSKVHNVSPLYPEIAKQARVQGVVILEAAISASGAVQNVRVLRGNPLLNDAAVEAVEQWRYTPTLLNGVAVPVLMTVTVNFQLAD